MTDTSFLPEDYLAKQAERRTNVISLTLFVVVMGAVFGAFLVTNRQATQIKAAQAAINAQYREAAERIEELNVLEQQKQQMLNKAELATALLERVPRSILLAEFINRMPERLSLREFELSSKQVKATVERPSAAKGSLAARKNKPGGPERAKTREEAMEERTIEAPKYIVEVAMVGVAPTDLEVSQYISQLNAYPLLRDVTLKYSVQTEIDERTMREFRVEMRLDPNADIREISPLVVPRDIRDPMTDELRFTVPGGAGGGKASVDPDGPMEN